LKASLKKNTEKTQKLYYSGSFFLSQDKCNGKGKGKGKAILVQAWTGPEGFRSVRLPDFRTIDT